MKKIAVLLISISCLLCGCVPVAFVAGATAGGAIIYDNRSVKTIAQDREITYAAEKKIANDPDLNGQVHISVATFNHIVLLVGQARTQALAQKAYTLVSSLPNIRRIYNEITVQELTSNAQRSKDVWITTKVKTAMLAEKGLNSSQIKVVTENNIVYLMGLVSHAQGNLAALVASQVAGVQKVVKLFEYIN